jgi:hypothetical protein
MAYDKDDAETKQAIKDAVDVAIAEATSGLVAKNQELLGKLKKATKDAAIDPAEFQALQTEKEALETKLSEVSKTLKTTIAEADKNKKALETEAGFVSRLLVDNGLNDALIKAGVKPEMTKAVKALLASQVQLKQDGDNRIAVVGDKALADYVSEWSKSDEGKHFVAAPVNQGGGANGGSNGKGTAKTISRTAFDALDAAAKTAFAKDGGTITDS